jgi:UvrD-like helicase family protein
MIHEITLTVRRIVEDWRIVCATKSRAGGIDATNRSMHASNPNADEDDEYAVGDPVIHLSNDYERGLMNGSLGCVVEMRATGVMVIDFEGERHCFEPDEVAQRIAVAYAVSCHKAQGSQFDRVAVVVTPSRILDHSLIYTALTRAVKQVVLIGSKAAFTRVRSLNRPTRRIGRCASSTRNSTLLELVGAETLNHLSGGDVTRDRCVHHAGRARGVRNGPYSRTASPGFNGIEQEAQAHAEQIGEHLEGKTRNGILRTLRAATPGHWVALV